MGERPADRGGSEDLATLEELNRGYVRSAAWSDVQWYADHLAEDFMSSSVDGSIIDRSAFLERVARPYPGRRPAAQDVRIRLLGDIALIHAGFSYEKADGTAGTGRYTDIWARRAGRWVCISAHFNRF